MSFSLSAAGLPAGILREVVVDVPFALGNGEPIFHVVGCRALDVASVVEERSSGCPGGEDCRSRGLDGGVVEGMAAS